MQIITHSVEETVQLGELIGSFLKEGMCICLDGDLGAGKTHLTKGIAKGLGISEDITSPTFTIIQEYDARLKLFHFDMYRLSDESELYAIGFEDYLKQQGVLVIEWSPIARRILPEDRLEIGMEYTEMANERRISFRSSGKKSQILVEKIGREMAI